MTLNEWFKEERARRGLTLQQVEDAGGPTITTTHRLEAGSGMSIETAEKLASAYKLRLSTIFRRLGK